MMKCIYQYSSPKQTAWTNSKFEQKCKISRRSVCLIWVPGQQGVNGNIKPGELAKHMNEELWRLTKFEVGRNEQAAYSELGRLDQQMIVLDHISDCNPQGSRRKCIWRGTSFSRDRDGGCLLLHQPCEAYIRNTFKNKQTWSILCTRDF